MGCVRAMIAPFIIAASLAGLAGTAADAAPAPVRYSCAPGEALTIARDRSSARVSYAGRTYDLQRKRSDIGLTYLSEKAALVIDGNSAVFVSDDHFDLGTCVKGVPLASAH